MSRAELSDHLLSIKSALVIDDHPLYCDALATTMESIFNTRRIRTATSLGEALQQLRMRFSPDLIILDLNLPDASGLSGFMKIKEKTPDIPVIVISAITTEGVVQSVMAAGAAGFIPKDTGRQTFQDAMRDIWNGKTYVPPGYTLPTRAQATDRSVETISRKIAHLSQQQTRILSLICEGMPNKLIAYEMQLAEATVKAHITALLRRLGVHNRTQAAMLVREVSIRHSLQ
ncbi:MAG: response regulator transcription factor [Alphaproteobacteria bacterium]|jgi:DNA-binding NarL/FixJ family response regulator|nr:response regulator transcription factor [Rhizobiaceae bacterium]MBC7152275.1 response regulator transcription factor [Rhizobium sp.]MBU3960297.1 response regulator transcription factor [Alphaproteobacteria bacterium]MBU4048626.1 response regulator transcription factor [Alphaproteobacteria bacterium]MBU4088955.1 response regulator transcription factor [Alphaproteobacteria bacterium]